MTKEEVQKHLDFHAQNNTAKILAVMGRHGYRGELTLLALFALQKAKPGITKEMDQAVNPQVGFEKLLNEARKHYVKGEISNEVMDDEPETDCHEWRAFEVIVVCQKHIIH